MMNILKIWGKMDLIKIINSNFAGKNPLHPLKVQAL